MWSLSVGAAGGGVACKGRDAGSCEWADAGGRQLAVLVCAVVVPASAGLAGHMVMMCHSPRGLC